MLKVRNFLFFGIIKDEFKRRLLDKKQSCHLIFVIRIYKTNITQPSLYRILIYRINVIFIYRAP